MNAANPILAALAGYLQGKAQKKTADEALQLRKLAQAHQAAQDAELASYHQGMLRNSANATTVRDRGAWLRAKGAYDNLQGRGYITPEDYQAGVAALGPDPGIASAPTGIPSDTPPPDWASQFLGMGGGQALRSLGGQISSQLNPGGLPPSPGLPAAPVAPVGAPAPARGAFGGMAMAGGVPPTLAGLLGQGAGAPISTAPLGTDANPIQTGPPNRIIPLPTQHLGPMARVGITLKQRQADLARDRGNLVQSQDQFLTGSKTELTDAQRALAAQRTKNLGLQATEIPLEGHSKRVLRGAEAKFYGTAAGKNAAIIPTIGPLAAATIRARDAAAAATTKNADTSARRAELAAQSVAIQRWKAHNAGGKGAGLLPQDYAKAATMKQTNLKRISDLQYALNANGKDALGHDTGLSVADPATRAAYRDELLSRRQQNDELDRMLPAGRAQVRPSAPAKGVVVKTQRGGTLRGPSGKTWSYTTSK